MLLPGHRDISRQDPLAHGGGKGRSEKQLPRGNARRAIVVHEGQTVER